MSHVDCLPYAAFVNMVVLDRDVSRRCQPDAIAMRKRGIGNLKGRGRATSANRDVVLARNSKALHGNRIAGVYLEGNRIPGCP